MLDIHRNSAAAKNNIEEPLIKFRPTKFSKPQFLSLEARPMRIQPHPDRKEISRFLQKRILLENKNFVKSESSKKRRFQNSMGTDAQGDTLRHPTKSTTGLVHLPSYTRYQGLIKYNLIKNYSNAKYTRKCQGATVS